MAMPCLIASLWRCAAIWFCRRMVKTLKRVGTEMALHVLAYNLKRVMNIMGIGPLIAAMSAA